MTPQIKNPPNTAFLFMFLTALLSSSLMFSQSMDKGFSKQIALYRAKFFITDLIGATEEQKNLIIDPLAASSSSEVTSIFYESENQRGLLLGFFDMFWDKGGSGTAYQGYGFKNLPEEKALLLMDKIERIREDEKKFLGSDDNVNNVFFKFDDMTIIIYIEGNSGRVRISWDGFDGEWDETAFKRTKRRFEKNIK